MMFTSLKKKFRRRHDGSFKVHTPESPSIASPTASHHTSESALPLDQSTSTLETTQRPNVLRFSNTETARAASQEAPLSTPKESERWSELKQTALGTLKTFLELGALASQALPTGMVKGVLECSTYMIKMVEVSYHGVQCRTLRLTNLDHPR